jgi:hypothetical protein
VRSQVREESSERGQWEGETDFEEGFVIGEKNLEGEARFNKERLRLRERERGRVGGRERERRRDRR